MSFIRSLCCLFSLTLALAFAAPASATTTFALTDFVGAGSPSGPFGSVELTQDGLDVDVQVNLTGGETFVPAATGWALFFDLSGIPSITVSDISKKFKVYDTNPRVLKSAALGTFNYGIVCSSCSTGPLQFTVDNVSISDFVANNSGNYFAALLCVEPTANACRLSGYATAQSGVTGTAVPEAPTTWLFVAGLLIMGLMARFSLKRAEA